MANTASRQRGRPTTNKTVTIRPYKCMVMSTKEGSKPKLTDHQL